MSKVSLDYIVKFTEKDGVPDVSLDFLHQLLVVAVQSTSATPSIVEITDTEELSDLINKPEEVQAAFDGGLDRVHLALVDTVDQVPDLIADQENSTFTVTSTSDFTGVELTTALESWPEMKAITTDDKTVAEEFALKGKSCAFFDAAGNAYGTIYAFAKLLSATNWANQQYIELENSNVSPVLTTGDAESLRVKGVSFFADFDDIGTRLSFFQAGLGSITDRYIEKELYTTIQSDIRNYLALNQPYNTNEERADLEFRADKIVSSYVDKGYLDGSGTNDVAITKADEKYKVSGTITTTKAWALWAVELEATQI